MVFSPSDEVRAIKARLGHPIIDADGHSIEYLPLVRDILREQAGPGAVTDFDRLIAGSGSKRRLSPQLRRMAGLVRTAWWGLPARNTLDRATAMLPPLLATRLEEVGIDHAVVYPTYGLVVIDVGDDDLRRALSRAFNTFYATVFADHRELLTPAGIIPMHDPDEAIAELDFATSELGLKAFLFGGPIQRPVSPGKTGLGTARWLDTLGLDSAHDYDPLWARCTELGVAPTFHAASLGWGSRSSPTNFIYNHIGMFSSSGEALARSLFLGGVPHRFPQLRFAFQEGGVAWAASLYADLVGHWEKRNRDHLEHYNPASLDRDELVRLFEAYGSARYRGRLDALDEALGFYSFADEDPATLDEFALSGVESAEDIRDVYAGRFHFGCEADDPLTPVAFAERNPLGARLKALFASDIGHWDVPDIRFVVEEAWELVEDGAIGPDDFQALTFGNAVSLWCAGDPLFFAGTSVGDAVAKHLADAS
jgi:predicted TIM-barrel fold metal-dependent hydrolase